MRNCKMLKRIVTGILAVAMVMSTVELPVTEVYAAESEKTTLNIGIGDIEFGCEDGKNFVKVNGVKKEYDSDGYIITGNTTMNTITVSGGEHDIMLQDASLMFYNSIEANVGKNPFTVASGATVDLILSGRNSMLATRSDTAALCLSSESELRISGTGNLVVGGGETCFGNGIYGNGNMTISGGTVFASSGWGDNKYAVGIKTLTINGGSLIATPYRLGTGIFASKLTIYGGNVYVNLESSREHTMDVDDFVVTGGNIDIGGYPEAKNETGETVKRYTFTLTGLNEETKVTEVKGIGDYNIKDVTTCDTNKLYFYLPENFDSETISATVNGMEFSTKYGGTFDKENREITLRTNHTHQWKYEMSEDTITARCTTNDDSLCDYADKYGGSVTLLPPDGLFYDGEKKNATVSQTGNLFEDIKITYKDKDGQELDDAPKDIGEYTASITVEGQTVSVPFEIVFHEHTWRYEVCGDLNDELYVECVKEDGSTSECNVNGTLTFVFPENRMCDGNEKIVTVSSTNPEVPIPEVVYRNGKGEEFTSAPIEPGIYRVFITAGGVFASKYYTIVHLSTEAKVSINGTKADNGWYLSDVSVAAPEGYQIKKTISDPGVQELKFTEDMTGEFSYYLEELETGYFTELRVLNVKIDSVPPTGEIRIGDNSFKTVCNPITYEQFYKDEVSVSIAGNDAKSGVSAIDYQVVKRGAVYNEKENWIGGDKITINEPGEYVIYARVTDDAGNTTIINSNGIVVYKDSVLAQQSIGYECGTCKDVSVGVTLNGNTLTSIQLDKMVLVKDTDYILEGETITFRSSCLDDLADGIHKMSFTFATVGDAEKQMLLTQNLDVSIINRYIYEIPINLTAPIAGTIPQKSIVEGNGYTERISWNCNSEKFGFHTVYTATITLVPDEKFRFKENLKVPGYTVVYNTDGSITLSRKFEATRKAVLTTLTPPEVQQFGAYNATLEEALKYLNTKENTVVVTAEDGVTTLPVKWSFAGNYIAQKEAMNTFSWKLDTENYTLGIGVVTEGTVQIQNMDGVQVAVTAKDAESVYQEESYDVSRLFEISEHTGNVRYVVENVTGEGVLEGSELTIHKAGKFRITVIVDAAGQYDAAIASAVLTIKKATGSAEVEIEDWVYGEKAKPPIIDTEEYDAAEAIVTYTSVKTKDYNSNVPPMDAGEYQVTITLPENHLYNSISADTTFVIEPRAIEGAVITLGKPLLYNGKKQRQTVAGVTVDGIELKPEDYVVTDNEVVDTDTEYTLTITGCGNFTGVETMDFTVGKVEAPLIADINKNYLYRIGSNKKTVAVDIAKWLPQDRGTTTYTYTDSPMEYIQDTFVDDDGKLTYLVEASTAVGSTSIVVKAITQKYQDINIRVNITLTDKYVSEDMPGMPIIGATLTDAKNKAVYKVTKAGFTGGTVEYVKPVKASVDKVKIPETIHVDGITYYVTGIAKNACMNSKKLKQVTIGKNVKNIGANAFYGCKELKKITIKTSNLTKKTVGMKSFKGVYEKVTIKVPKKKIKPYQNLLKAKGTSSKANIRKL